MASEVVPARRPAHPRLPSDVVSLVAVTLSTRRHPRLPGPELLVAPDRPAEGGRSVVAPDLTPTLGFSLSARPRTLSRFGHVRISAGSHYARRPTPTARLRRTCARRLPGHLVRDHRRRAVRPAEQ